MKTKKKLNALETAAEITKDLKRAGVIKPDYEAIYKDLKQLIKDDLKQTQKNIKLLSSRITKDAKEGVMDTQNYSDLYDHQNTQEVYNFILYTMQEAEEADNDSVS